MRNIHAYFTLQFEMTHFDAFHITAAFVNMPFNKNYISTVKGYTAQFS